METTIDVEVNFEPSGAFNACVAQGWVTKSPGGTISLLEPGWRAARAALEMSAPASVFVERLAQRGIDEQLSMIVLLMHICEQANQVGGGGGSGGGMDEQRTAMSEAQLSDLIETRQKIEELIDELNRIPGVSASVTINVAEPGTEMIPLLEITDDEGQTYAEDSLEKALNLLGEMLADWELFSLGTEFVIRIGQISKREWSALTED
ncbi:MAG: hypothetical protein SF162_01255 [bacterium]|nr:hypothetical protein [bacterium]